MDTSTLEELQKEIINLKHRVRVLESHERVLCGNGKTQFVHIIVEDYALEKAKEKREAKASRVSP